MRRNSHRVLGRVVVLSGLILASYPLVARLTAKQGQAPQAPRPTINQPTDSALRGFKWRSIGPVGQGARIDDFAVDEANPSTFYIGFAVSGLWKTTNNGTTFTPLMDELDAHSIGDIAIAPSNPDVLYVGTGEANNRQSSSFGTGVYKTTDGGKTWKNVGLAETQSIGRIRVHPKNPDIAWVAAMGHLFGPNPERGIYMTSDGGTTWQQVLKINQDTGANDIIVDPSNPNHLFATTYERRRTGWGFVGGGMGSGIWESVDGGKNWKPVKASPANGLPHGTMGRIDMDWCKTNPKVIYAQIEVAPDKEPKAPEPAGGAPAANAGGGGGGRGGGGRGGRGGGGGGAAVTVAAGAGAAGAGAAGAGAAGGAAIDPALAAQFGGGGGGRGGGNQPPDPQSSGIWRSMDGGKTWEFRSNQNQRPMYFSQIRVDPNNPEIVFVGGVNAQKSIDGGKTFTDIEGNKGHVDNHAIWIDPLNSQHVMYGNDGGLDVSWDGGQTFEAVRLWGAGLPYAVSVDMRHPYWVCTGLQDNGSWCGPSSTRSGGIHMWNWISVGGGDGFQSAIDPSDPRIFYTESQNGAITKYDLNTGQTSSVRPQGGGGGGRGGGGGGGGAAAGAGAGAGGFAGGGGGRGNILGGADDDGPNAWNWNTPIRLSPHNGGTLLIGGSRLYISRDRGASWTQSIILGKKLNLDDRTLLEQKYSLPACRQGAPGVECILSRHDGYTNNEFGTVVEIAESPMVPGVIWAGTNDGNVQLSKDGGFSWTEVGKNVPGGGTHENMISGLEASWYEAGTAYLSIDGHYNDDLKPHVYKTTDYGATWKDISGNLPMGNVNSIRQDPKNRNLLYACAEFGFYVSLNDGQSWSAFMSGLPKGRIDEVMVHPRDNDLVLASHGRSVWILDDVTALQNLTATAMDAPATLFKPRDAIAWKADRMNQTEVPGNKFWSGDVAPRGTAIAYYLKAAPPGDVMVSITNTATGQVVRNCVGGKDAGMNRFQWALTGDGAGGGGGGRGGGGGGGGRGGAPVPDPNAAPAGPSPCQQAAGGGGRGGGGGGGGFGGGGGIGPGVYKVTLTIAGTVAGTQTFSVLEDVWLNEK